MRTWAWAIAVGLAALAVFGAWRHLPPFGPRKPVRAPAARVRQPAPATLTCVGDILLAGGVGRLAAARGTDHIFAGVGDLLRSDSLTIGNLECAAATTGTPAAKQFTFRADPRLLAGLRRSGIEAVSLANNHSMDYGAAALRETLAQLRRAGIASAGAGADLEQATRPALLQANGQTVALVAASRVVPSGGWCAGAGRPGVASAYDPTRLLGAIRAARAKSDIVVVYLHWSKESASVPLGYQPILARQCIDAGADLVVGSHPHVLQGFEYYRGRLIAYSLGNFVFTNASKPTVLLRTTFRNRVMQSARVVPCRIINYRPHLIADARERERLLRSLEMHSSGIRIGADGSLSAAPRG